MPHLKELYKKYKDKGLEIVGVHTKNAGERMAAYVKENKIPWPVTLDAKEKTIPAFHVDSFPDYYVVDRAGKLRVADLANADLERVIQILLKEKAPKTTATSGE